MTHDTTKIITSGNNEINVKIRHVNIQNKIYVYVILLISDNKCRQHQEKKIWEIVSENVHEPTPGSAKKKKDTNSLQTA